MMDPQTLLSIYCTSPRNKRIQLTRLFGIDIIYDALSQHFNIPVEVLKNNRREFRMRLYMYQVNMNNIPVCELCQKSHCTFIDERRGFSKLCSLCQRKQTNMKKYGADNPLKVEEIKEKVQQTNLRKYGVRHAAQSTLIKEKMKNTMKEKYGVEWAMQSEELKNKARETIRNRYGVDHFMHLEEFKQKLQHIHMSKRGVKNPGACPFVKKKREETMLQRYGVTNFSKHEKFKEKASSSFQEKLGVPWGSKSSYVREKVIATCLDRYGVESPKTFERYNNIVNKIDTDSFQILSDFEYFKQNKVVKVECKSCRFIFNMFSVIEKCPQCTTKFSSVYEQEIFDFLQKELRVANISIREKNVLDNQFEIDLYLPEYKVGIEFNGIYWHSEARLKDPLYHKRKQDKAEEKGITLLQIFEDEWLYDNHIVKNIIKYHLGKIDCRIFARNCTVDIIDNYTAKNFLDKYHLKGYRPAKFHIGLIHNDKVVSVMSIDKARYTTYDSLEIIRIATITDMLVVGGVSKLVTFFKNKILKERKPFITYTDRRYYSGKSLKTLDWKLVRVTEPGYYYVHFNTEPIVSEDGSHTFIRERRYSRMNFQKHKLIQMFPSLPKNWSESEIMGYLGFVRIYDSGNLVFVSTP